MKHPILFALVLFACTALTAQSIEKPTKEPVRYGFSAAITHSSLTGTLTDPTNSSISNGAGLRFGVFGNCTGSKFFSFSPKAEISFNNAEVLFTDAEIETDNYSVAPVTVDFMTHFIFKKKGERYTPYFLVGPNVKIPISKIKETENTFDTKMDAAIDFGIGLETHFLKFNLAPELRFSYGLLDVNKHRHVEQLNMHTVSLVLNFLG